MDKDTILALIRLAELDRMDIKCDRDFKYKHQEQTIAWGIIERYQSTNSVELNVGIRNIKKYT